MKNIILDTDLGCDCDDAGAIAVLHNLANRDECEILSISSCTSRKDAAYAIQVLNNYYGRSDLPIGIYTEGAMLNGDGPYYTKAIINHYKYKDIKINSSVSLYRKLLSESEDKSIEFIGIGPLNTLSELINSEADEYSSLNGVELIKKKVKCFYIMMGHFPIGNEVTYLSGQVMNAEWNILQDIKSAQNFMEKCPVDIRVFPYDIGKVKTGNKLFEEINDSPVRYAYLEHNNGVRESWDPITVYVAVRGVEDGWYFSEKGKITIGDDGVSKHQISSDGKHYVLYQKGEDEAIIKKIDSLLY